MSYVKRVLQPGEVVRHTASLHWILYARGMLILIAGGVIFLFLPDRPDFVRWAAVVAVWLCFVVGLVHIAWTWFIWWITEIAVTNRRVIYKTGFIWRNTTEINMDKVESVDVDQTILGRILDYGTVYVHGTGEALLENLQYIAAPLELRNHIIAV